jgi:hypothetical protein
VKIHVSRWKEPSSSAVLAHLVLNISAVVLGVEEV